MEQFNLKNFLEDYVKETNKNGLTQHDLKVYLKQTAEISIKANLQQLIAFRDFFDEKIKERRER